MIHRKKVGLALSQVELLELIQSHGIILPDEVKSRIVDTEGKLWKDAKAVTAAMIRALIQDYYRQKSSKTMKPEDLGWRNRYNIHLLSGLSQRTIYQEWGVIEMLVESDFLERRPSLSHWGRQKYRYRLNLDFLPKSTSLLKSIQLFIEGDDD